MARAKQHELAGEHCAAAAIYRDLLRKNAADAAARKALARLPLDALAPAMPSPEVAAEKARFDAALNGARWSDVLQIGQPLMARMPGHASVPTAMGFALVMLGRRADAIRAFNHAIKVDPAHAPAYVNLASVLRMTGQLDAADGAISAALHLTPQDPDTLAAQGQIADDLDRPDQAEASFRAALAADPENVPAHDGLCRLFENSNRSKDLEKAVQAAFKALPHEPPIQLRKAQLLYRNEDHVAALDLLHSIVPDALQLELRGTFWELLGKASDALGQTDAAFDAFEKMNAVTAQRYGIDADARASYRRTLAARHRNIPLLVPDTWNAPPLLDHATPVFLVGFPRSGTTLLDTALRGHPDALVAEELPTVQNLGDGIVADTMADQLNAMSDDEIEARRARYFADFEAGVGDRIGTRLPIDKMPFNLTDVALIRRIFPDAKFVLSLRHPADCVLSAFMQNFKPNPAMNGFLTLEGAAETYHAAFSLWTTSVKALDPPLVVVRYEKLITDMEATLRPVFDLIDLPWTPKVLDTKNTAQARGKIKTSSYRQVIKDIYTSAEGRWRRYDRYLASILPTLSPWIDHWGYSR